MFKQIKQNAIAAVAAILFSATMVGAAIGPVQVADLAKPAVVRA
jgi:hypothetical protein